jgi:hypothetical protein
LAKSAPPPGRRRTEGTQQPTPARSTRSVPAQLQRRCGCPCKRLRLGEVSASARAEAREGYATAHSGRVDQVGAGNMAAAVRLSVQEAAPGRSQRLRSGGGEGRVRNSPLRSRSAPSHLTFCTHAILSQNGCAARYAVKALLARSVLACGCAPHAACDRVHDRARRSATPASRRRVHGDGSAPACAPLLCGCSTQQQPQLRGACSCPAPDPRTRDSGNPAPLSNRNILLFVNSLLW